MYCSKNLSISEFALISCVVSPRVLSNSKVDPGQVCPPPAILNNTTSAFAEQFP